MAKFVSRIEEEFYITKKRNIAVIVLVFIILTAAYAFIANNALINDRRNIKARAQLNASVYASEIKTDFSKGITVAEAVEQAVIASKGNIDNFQEIAENLLEDYIGSIQLAPGGTVTQIVPLEGNEAGLINLMEDKDRGPFCAYARDNDTITFQGPFDLKQGGKGIAIRDPIFLTDREGNRSFWGFSIVIIKSEVIFQNTFDALSSFGYDYALTVTANPLEKEEKVVAASAENLSSPVSADFEIGECTWRIDVAPVNGWKTSKEQILFSLTGLLFVILCTVLVGFLLTADTNRRKLKLLVETDNLTGIMNRTGLVNEIGRFFNSHPEGPVTEAFLDIDDFKLINDLHGHSIGDEALVNLAKNLTSVFDGRGIVARTGGDEFAVFLPGCKAEEAEKLIRKASDMDQTFTATDGKSYTYTISIGYADFPSQAKDRADLARNVDGALYNVKLNGKHGCQRYETGMAAQSREQLGFSKKELVRNLPGASFICHGEDTKLLYVNDDLLRTLECSNFEEFTSYSKGMFRNIIHPDDFERVMAERMAKLQNAGPDEFITCFFRIITRTGKVKPMRAQARFSTHPNYGGLFFVMLMERGAGDSCTISKLS